MAQEYTKDQLWKLYYKLPRELKDAVFSEKTAENIFNICMENGIKDGRISEVARYTGRVLLGILSPDKLQETIETEIKLKDDVAKKVVQEINLLVFSPVRSGLAQFYKKELLPKKAKEQPKRSGRKDSYREPIE